jgi:dihydroflavonol-4-reductase
MKKKPAGRARGTDSLTSSMARESEKNRMYSQGKDARQETRPREAEETEQLPLSLVTGATGRLGKYLVRALLSKGERVRVLHRQSSTPAEFPQGAQIAYGDLTDRQSLERAVEDVDCVYHLAALVSHSARPNQLLAANYEGTQNIIDACKTKGFALKRFVYVSTISVYGKSIETLPADEATPTNPSDWYGRTKAMAEGVVAQYSSKIPTVILRPAVIYGEEFDEAYLPVLSALEKGRMQMIGNGSNIIPFIHAIDVVRALLLAAKAEKAPGNTYVIASPERKTQREILALASRHLGVQPPTGATPVWLAKLKLKAANLLPFIFGKPKILEEHIDTIAANRYFSTEKAEADLGFRATVGLEQGIKEMVEYYRKRKGGAQ